jgi:hypothetical protein
MEVCPHDKAAGSLGDEPSHIVCAVSGLGIHLTPPCLLRAFAGACPAWGARPSFTNPTRHCLTSWSVCSWMAPPSGRATPAPDPIPRLPRRGGVQGCRPVDRDPGAGGRHPGFRGPAAAGHRADRCARGAGAASSHCTSAVLLGHGPDGPTSWPSCGRQHAGRRQWGKSRCGRQLARVSAPQDHERLVSLVYPGNQTRQACVRPTVAAVERVLGLPPVQRRRTMLCLDGGVGPDANLTWALWQGYQVLAKGYSGTRAQACARGGTAVGRATPGGTLDCICSPAAPL